jgi:hypothetical protein
MSEKPTLQWLHDNGLWPDDCPTKEHGEYCCLACDHEIGRDCACFEILEGFRLWRKQEIKVDE